MTALVTASDQILRWGGGEGVGAEGGKGGGQSWYLVLIKGRSMDERNNSVVRWAFMDCPLISWVNRFIVKLLVMIDTYTDDTRLSMPTPDKPWQ